jgi:hypothetical protein
MAVYRKCVMSGLRVAGLAMLCAWGSNHAIGHSVPDSRRISPVVSDAATSGELTWKRRSSGPPRRTLEFVSLRDKINAGEVQLSNGEQIHDPNLWTSVVVADLDSQDFCTATLIGPHVLLTAAHCVDAKLPGSAGRDQRATIGGTIVINEKPPLTLKDCEMSAPYAQASLPQDDTPRSSEDYALCEVVGNVTNVLFESLYSGASAQAGDRILMAGYGCINIRVVNGKIETDDGKDKLRVGDAKIEATGVWNSGAALGTYIRTRAEHGEPILCPGDSGGPVFRGATLARQDGPQRRVMAVNSKVTAIPNGRGYAFLSFMTPVTSKTFQDFLSKWIAKSSALRQVCGDGIAPGFSNCRA